MSNTLQPPNFNDFNQNSTVNPLLSRHRIPGETFPLPSMGVLYEGTDVLSPEIVDGEVHVYPMTAVDELLLRSVDKIFSGEAVKEIFARCIPSVLQPGKLIQKDVDFLIIALRKVSYGSTFDITHVHDCNESIIKDEHGNDLLDEKGKAIHKIHTHTLSLDDYIKKVHRLSPTSLSESMSWTLSGEFKIDFRPLEYDQWVNISQKMHSDRVKRQQQILAEYQSTGDQDLLQQRLANMESDEIDNKEKLNEYLTSIAQLIKSVNNVTDQTFIVEWLSTLPVLELKEICDRSSVINDWGIDPTATITCPSCNKQIVIETAFNPISFFI